MGFDAFLGDSLNVGGASAAALCSSPLCDPARGSIERHSATIVDNRPSWLNEGHNEVCENSQCASAKRLGRLFVIVWMRAVAAQQRSAAYQLLVKLCAARLIGLPDVATVSK